MRLAIVDDDTGVLQIVQSIIQKNSIVSVEKCDIIHTPQGVLEKIERGQLYDVYLLDIELPQMNGLELAKQIRAIQENAYIIFLTAYANFALASYDIHIRAYQYILKDEAEKRLPETLEKINSEMLEKETEFYVIKTSYRYEKIRIFDIVYIYKEGKNSVFVTADKEYKERIALKEVMPLLSRKEFIFFDNGRIINIRHINSVGKDKVVLNNGTELYASYINIKKIKEKIVSYWSGVL